MDLFSTTIGFLVGAITGAAAAYMGDMFTDKRRKKEKLKIEEDNWNTVCSKFTSLIDEMRADVLNPKFKGVRKFYVMTTEFTMNNPESIFFYRSSDHSDLEAAVSFLLDLGYVCDITEGDCPKYRMYEHFIEKLENA